MRYFFLTLILLSVYGNAYSQISHYALSEITSYQLSHRVIKGKTKQFKIANHFYKNKNTKLYVSVHGYLESCGYIKHINSFLIKNNYDVLCIDLPGLGESSGSRAQIDDFETYGHVLDQVDFTTLRTGYSEINFIGHSTGALTYLNYRRRSKESPFNKVILLAPLIRSRVWYPSVFGHFFAKYFIDTLKRKPKKSVIFNQIKKSDPNYFGYMSLSWFGKLIEWNDLIKEKDMKFKSDKIFALFGEKDEVIDTDYNRKYYGEHFKMVSKTIKNAHHHIDHDELSIRQEFYQTLGEYINK